MKLAAVVTVYHPDEKVLGNIQTYAAAVESVFVMDNTEHENTAFAWQVSEITNVRYHKFEENMGIALRLNQACEMAQKIGCDWILTMDQDSSFSENEFIRYKALATSYFAKNANTGIFAVNFQPEITPKVAGPQKILSTITSGSIVNLKAHEKIGGYDEKLFIDLVDAEFCYRLNSYGYDAIMFADIVLNHMLGQFVAGRSLKNLKISNRRIHSPIRIYYITRNSLWLLKNGNLSPRAKQEIKTCLSLLKNNFLYHPQKGKVYGFFLQGVMDAYKNKLGKYIQNKR